MGTPHADDAVPPLHPDALVRGLGWRASIKKFDPSRKIPEKTWGALERALVLSPSSFGLQPWRFLVVTDPAVRARLKAHSWNQPQITDASHLVVFARRREMTDADLDRHVDRIIEVRGVARATLDGFRSMVSGFVANPAMKDRAGEWNARQVYIALGVFLTSCALVGVDACPMEGFDPAGYDGVLGLPQHGYLTTVVAAAGYRAPDDPYSRVPKVRFPHADVVRRV
jgi:nitroreductase